MNLLCTTVAFTAIFAATPALAQEAQTFETEAVKVKAEALVDGLEHPWGLDFLPDGRAIVTERPGRMRILSGGELSEPLRGVPEVYARGQGGLLDVLADRDFAQNRTIYFSYAEPGEHGVGTAVARDRKSTRLNSSHVKISYAVFC